MDFIAEDGKEFHITGKEKLHIDYVYSTDVDATAFLKSAAPLSGAFNYKVTVPSNVISQGYLRLLLAPQPWFSLNQTERFSVTALQRYGVCYLDVTTSSLWCNGVLCTQDIPSVKDCVTITFGVTSSFDDNGNYQWIVYYLNHDGQGKEYITDGQLPGNLYFALIFERPLQNIVLDYSGHVEISDYTPVRVPHMSPVGLFEYSPDNKFVASYSANDGILTVWRLYNDKSPLLAYMTHVNDMNIVGKLEADHADHEQLTIVVSDPNGSGFPTVALSRYHNNLEQQYWRIMIFEFTPFGVNSSVFRQGNDAGHLHLLGDGVTLLVLNGERLFVLDFRSLVLQHSYDTMNLYSLETELPITLSPGPLPLLPLNTVYFIWHTPGYVSLWKPSTGSLYRKLRLNFGAGDKYDFDEQHGMLAFYDGSQLRVISIAGVTILEIKTYHNTTHVAGVKFVTVGNELQLLTIECSEIDYVWHIWNPFTGQSTRRENKPHCFSTFYYTCFLYIGEEQSSFSLGAQLGCTVAYTSIEHPYKKADIATTPVCSDQRNEKIAVEINPVYESYQIILKWVDKTKQFGFAPEQWNNVKPTYHWLSDDRLLVVGIQSVLIIDVMKSSRQRLIIEHIWCVPREGANITDTKLCWSSTDENKTLTQFVMTYQDGLVIRTESIDVGGELSLKHVACYIQFAGERFHKNLPSKACSQVITSALQSTENLLRFNEIDFITSTSTLGHIIRGPQMAALQHIKTFLNKDMFRPHYYGTTNDVNALTEALEIQNYDIVKDIVQYCLRHQVFNPGYIAIVIAELPTISKRYPVLATEIAQKLSLIPSDPLESDNQCIGKYVVISGTSTCAERLLDTETWWTKLFEFINNHISLHRSLDYLFSYNHPSGISYTLLQHDLNQYQPSKISPFATLALDHSVVFDEPAFQAVVQHKWKVFARKYYLFQVVIYMILALMYLIAVSINDANVLANAAVKWTITVLAVLCLLLLESRVMYYRCRRNWSKNQFLSSYRLIDRFALVMVIISTLFTSTDYANVSVNIHSWTVLILWLFVLCNFRLFEGTGIIINIFMHLLSSILPLLLFMAVVIFAFAHTLLVLLRSRNPPGFDNTFDSMYTTSITLLEFLAGDYSAINKLEASISLDILRVIFVLFKIIMMLNILIAIMKIDYTALRYRARKNWIRNMAEYIAIIEIYFLTEHQRDNRNLFPSKLHYTINHNDINIP